MAASEFIRLLESRGLLDPEIISELNRQVETSKVRVTPEAIAKLLVENGQLTRFQATRLISELNEMVDRSGSDPSVALRGGRPLEPIETAANDSVDDLLPDDIVEEVEEVAEVVVEDEQPVAEAVVVQAVSVNSSKSTASDDAYVSIPKKQVVRDNNAQKKNAWESFRILGVGFFLLLCLVALVPLVFWVMRGSAEEAFKNAEDAYEARDYERAAKLFSDFAYKFSGDEKASKARVQAVLAMVREDAEKVADPSTALERVQKELPKVLSETALEELKPDLTDTLLRIAEKFVSRMEASNVLEERGKLLEKMNEHMAIVKDPRYIGTQERNQNAIRINTIEEGKERAQRDLQKGKDLRSTLELMAKANDTKDVNKTYELRRELVRKYPILETDTKLNELLGVATGLQKELVLPATNKPIISTEPLATDSSARALLVNRTGNGDSSGTEVSYWKVKGSIAAVRVGDGVVLWRQFVGLDWTGEPLRITPTGESDVLVSNPEGGVLRRLAAQDGSLVWEAKFASRINSPQVDGDDVFITTRDGEAYALDAATGQVRWGKKFPQPIDVGMGGSPGKKRRYVVGNHSNIYVISRSSGDCEEVEYLGHNPGTIAIPPIWVVNHLLVFENFGADYSYLKIFNTNNDGDQVAPSTQLPITFKGHFVVEPQVEGRRFLLSTNLGEVAVYEVDANNPKDKVTKMAGSVEAETGPRVKWPMMSGTDLYFASNKLAMYQAQVTSQKLNRTWQKHDGDLFVSRPVKFNDAVLHARVVRGNLGVRIVSINPQNGDSNWETDLGVPVTAFAGDAKGFVALTAQGAIYALEPKSFRSKTPIQQVENLGANQTDMQFTFPITLQDGRIVAINNAKGNQLLLIDPTKKKAISRLVSIDFGGALPSNIPVAVGNNVIVPLSNAQLAMIDPERGQMVGIPFQPTIEAGERPQWLNPVVLEDKQTIIIADQKRSMYKISAGRQLRTVVQENLPRPLKGRLSVLGESVVAVSANDTGDQLDFYNVADLRRDNNKSIAVEGRFAWGPYVAKNDTTAVVMALSDVEGLIAVDGSGKRLWTAAIDRLVLVGSPIVVENDCIVATTTGELLRISLADGSLVARSTVGEPLGITPIALAAGLIVPCDEGCVLTVPMPSAK